MTEPTKTEFDFSQLKFRENGLIPAIIQDCNSGEVLMMAYMNRDSLDRTLESGRTWFWSRSRQELWLKGETSGHYQLVKQISADCDFDSLLIKVEQQGPGACHEGYVSCFHNAVQTREEVESQSQVFDPVEVYKKIPASVVGELYEIIQGRQADPKEGSYTSYLFKEGIDKILKKIGEESAEVIIAAKNEEREPFIYEVGDLLYHLLVLLAERGVKPDEVFEELKGRRK